MKAVAAVLLAAALAAAAAAWLWPKGSSETDPYRGSEAPPGLRIPEFALRDVLDGAIVRSADLRGKVVLVTFLDTACKESCPIIAGQIAAGLRLLAADERGDLVAVSITVNPRVDTTAHVRAFLRERRALGVIRYVTGSVAQLRPVWRAFHVLPAIDTGDDDVHSADVRVFDRRGSWVSTLHTGVDLSHANLAHDVRRALR